MTRHAIFSLSGIGLLVIAAAAVVFVSEHQTFAHCQVPCGIYDDAARIKHMKEDATTIEKAITNIRQMAGKHDPMAFNQAARWVSAKEDHASHIITTVSEYFLTQKVKPVSPGSDDYDKYLKSLADHHAVMVAAMKCKQGTDPATVASLNAAIDKLAEHY